ncbi:MAG: hypothetical protein AAFZ17_01440 [Cyanobacteria bacterium J06650_10]
MVTAHNIMFSKAAAATVLGCAASQVVQVRRFAFVAWVWVRGRRPQFVKLSLFKAAFVLRRMSAGNQLSVERWADVPQWFTVRNEKKKSSYPVEITKAGPVCRCEDYKNQRQFFGKGVCKHGYAVLQKLGYGSLGSYLAA